MTCEPCRQQLLPYLFDLLEPLEREQIAAHLECCPDCQAALVSARDQQGLLAAAVKEEHADIVFKAPTKTSAAQSAPTVLMERPRRRFFLSTRWAAAAAVLLFLFGGGGALGWAVWREHANDLRNSEQRLAKAKQDLEKAQDDLNQKKGQTQKDIRAIHHELDTLFNDWQKDEAKTRKVLEQQGAQLRIKGPPVAVAGANNPYEIELYKKGDIARNFDPAPPGVGRGKDQGQAQLQQQPMLNVQRLQVRAINQKTQKAVFEQDIDLQRGNQGRFVLPSNLPIKADEELLLEFRLQADDGKLITLTDSLKLVAPEYVTHLATDRPLYRPGDTVRFRSLTLERFSLKPAEQKFHLRYRIVGPDGVEVCNKEVASTVVGPNKQPIKGPGGEELHCYGAGEFALPQNLVAGKYALHVGEVNERFSEEKRAFWVNRSTAVAKPRLAKEVQFDRSSYAPGDTVKMVVRVAPVQPMPGGVRSEIQLNARVTVDGKDLPGQKSETNRDGKATFEFALPNKIQNEIAGLSIECHDGGEPEWLTREIPILVRNLQVEFYPEGGDLVAGVVNRIYFQARTPANRPADITGRIVDDKNAEVARVQTMTDATEFSLNQGLGVFSFVPEPGKRYKLVVDAPIGVERAFSLPKSSDRGVVMTIPEGVADNEIDVDLMSVDQRRILLVGAYCRGRMLDYKDVRAGANEPKRVTLKPNVDVAGVYRITVFEAIRGEQGFSFHPLAERLVYRKSGAKVDVAVNGIRPSYQPGDKVRLTLEARNERKVLVPTLATIAVVDTRALKSAKETTARSMPTHFLLTTEVHSPEALENADVLLGNHPKAAAALDLLLGTQGWRRFAEQNPQQFQEKLQEARNTNFLANNAPATQFLENEQKEIDELDQGYVKKAIALQQKLAESEKHESGPPELQQTIAERDAAVLRTSNELAIAEERTRQVRIFAIQFALGAGMLTLVLTGFFLISVGLRKLSDGAGKPRRWIGAGLGLLAALFIVSVYCTFAFMGREMFDLRGDGGGFKLGLVGNGPQVDLPAPQFNWNANVPEPAELWPQDEPIVAEPGGAKDKEDGVQKAVANPRQERNLAAPAQPFPVIGGGPQVGGPGAVDLRNDAQLPINNEVAQDDERLLRQQGKYQSLIVKQLGRRVTLPAANDPSIVREYAHKHAPRGELDRSDRAATIYWSPVVVMPDGKAEFAFDLTDAVTRFEVLVHSHTFDGRLGASRVEIATSLPFAWSASLPGEVCATDRIAVPLTVANSLTRDTTVSLSGRVKGVQVLNEAERRLTLKPEQAKRETFEIKPIATEGNAVLRFVGTANGLTGALERHIKIVPDGYPVTRSIGGVLENDSAEHEITLPDSWVAGSLQVQAHLYPSFLAELQGAQAELAREPTGFKRGFLSHAPSLLMLQQMSAHPKQANPFLEKRARALLQTATAKQADVEVYDLLQLTDLARLYPEDPELVERTRQTQLDRRDGKGGFKDAAGRRPDLLADAFILWALTESDKADDVDRELAHLRAQCKSSKDPTFIALVALGHLNRKKEAEGIALLQQVRGFQKADGVVSGSEFGIIGSQGRDLAVETTSLALLSWLKADRPWVVSQFIKNTNSAVKWLHQQRRGAGSYGGPLATALALKAMLAFQQRTPQGIAIEGGEASLTISQMAGGEPVDSGRAPFSAHTQDVVTLTLPNANALKPGKNVVALNVTGKNALPYTLTWTYRVAKLANDPNVPVTLVTTLDRAEANQNDMIKLSATVANATGKAQGPVVAVLGLPAGLTLADGAPQLRKLQADGRIAGWELRGRELIVSCRDLAVGAKVEIGVDLQCRFTGNYRGPASSVHLQAEPDRKFFAEPMDIRIVNSK